MITERQVIERLGISKSTMDRMKRRGEAPPAVRVGNRKLMYSIDDLNLWIELRTS